MTVKTINGYHALLIQKYNVLLIRLNDTVLRISCISLTLLVSLQNFYVPQNPKHLWLLQLAWAGFGVSVLFCFLFYYGEVRRLKMEKTFLDKKTAGMSGDFPCSGIKASVPMPSVFAICLGCSVACLVVAFAALIQFAILNLYPHSFHSLSFRP